jgi:hypothetical protein
LDELQPPDYWCANCGLPAPAEYRNLRIQRAAGCNGDNFNATKFGELFTTFGPGPFRDADAPKISLASSTAAEDDSSSSSSASASSSSASWIRVLGKECYSEKTFDMEGLGLSAATFATEGTYVAA